MKNESELSAKSNMSYGFIPIIITIILNGVIPSDMAVYIGTIIGVLSSAVYFFMNKPRLRHFILFSSTFILLLCSTIALFTGPENDWPQQFLPLALEVAILLPLLFFFVNRKRFSTTSYKNRKAKDLRDQVRVTTLTISGIRIFFGFASIHFALITLGVLFTRSLDNGFMWFMLHIAPILVFIFTILVGLIEIRILKGVKPPEFVPVVTSQGSVIGKVDKNLAEEYKNVHTNPIIRIAAVSHDMLFLSKRSSQRVIDKGKIDTPLETYLLFKEDINSGVARLLREIFPQDWEELRPEFSIKYRFKNEETDRLVYLFILDLGTDDEILCDPKFENGKLWTFQQIEYNLDQNYFSEMFENEYDHLKMIIETRGIYKES